MIVVGSTIPAFNAEGEHFHHWIQNAVRITETTNSEAGEGVEWVAVLQHDARGMVPFSDLLRLLAKLESRGLSIHTYWFSREPPAGKWETESRLFSICIGRNSIIDHALLRPDVSHIYFADSDIVAPDDVLVRLLELDWPVTGAHIPMYGQGEDAPQASSLAGREFPGDTRVHWNPAGSLLVSREVFRRVPWRWDPDAGCSDDPATQNEMEKLGWPTFVRHDLNCSHIPYGIPAIEHRGLDLKSYSLIDPERKH